MIRYMIIAEFVTRKSVCYYCMLWYVRVMFLEGEFDSQEILKDYSLNPDQVVLDIGRDVD